MTHAVSHGASSRRPLVHAGRKIANVYVRFDASGRQRYEYQQKRNGKTSRVTLAAQTPTDAVREADRLRSVAVEVGLGDGSLRLGVLSERFLSESRSGTYAPARGRLASSTLDLYAQRLGSHALPALGHSTRARDVKVEHLRLLVDRMRLNGLSGSTVRGTVAALSALFRFGVHRGLIQQNPVTLLDGDLPSAARETEPIYLDRADLDRLLDALSDEFRSVAATCAFAGLSGVVPMPAPLAAELREHRDRQARRGFDRIRPEALAFVTRTGRSPGRRNVLRAVQAQAATLDLGNLGLHDLRHSTAGLLREAGLPDEEIAVILRHSSARVTTALYGGRSTEAQRAVRQRAAEALA